MSALCKFVICNEPSMFGADVCNIHGRWNKCRNTTCGKEYLERNMDGYYYGTDLFCTICTSSKATIICRVCRKSYHSCSNLVVSTSSVCCVFCKVLSTRCHYYYYNGDYHYFNATTHTEFNATTHAELKAFFDINTSYVRLSHSEYYLYCIFLYKLFKKRLPSSCIFANGLIQMDRHILGLIKEYI